MRKPSPATRTAGIVMMIAVLAVAAGCESTSNWLKGRKTAVAEPVILGAPEANVYLTEMYELTSGDPATQAEIFADANSAATITPGTSTRLRYALMLATPGHAETNATEAQSILRELLSQTELMTPAEIALATIHLHEIEGRLVLDAEIRRLRDENTRAATTEEAAVARRITNVESENRRLRQSLADAEAKLEALSAIERSIREQSANTTDPH